MFMSSGHWTNTGMARFINDNLYNYDANDEKSMNPFRWYRLQNGEDVSKYRETINGFPCRLILVNDGESPLNTGQNEPTPGNTKDMGIFNFNNDKDNVTTLGFNSDIFPNCASYEVTANSDTSAGAFMSYKTNQIIEIAKQTVAGTEYYATMYTSPLLPNGSIVKTDAEISAAMRYRENQFTIFGASIAVSKQDEGVYQLNHNNGGVYYRILFNVNTCPTFIEINDVRYNVKIVEEYPENVVKEPYIDNSGELAYLKESFELRHPDADDVAEDWGFMGVENNVYVLDYFDNSNDGTRRTEGIPWDGKSAIIATKATRIACYNPGFLGSVNFTNGTAMPLEGTTHTVIVFPNQNVEYFMLNGRLCLMRNSVSTLITAGTLKEEVTMDPTLGLKALIDWVDNCTDEEFIRDFEQHFHKDYTLRYFCLVTLIGAVDNLGGQYSCRV